MSLQKPTIGADLSSTTLYLAVVENTKVLATAKLQITDLASDFNWVRNILRCYRDEYDVWQIHIEAPFVNGAVFPKSGMMLMRSATILECAAVDTNMESIFLHPLTWRKLVYGNGRPKDTKAAALEYLAQHFDFQLPTTKPKGGIPDHNVAESILIAHAGWLLGGNDD